MDLETILKLVALTIGGLLLVSNFVRVDSILAKLFPKNKKVQPQIVVESSEDEAFLHIINLWYQLKESCEKYNLQLAVDKIDEVFPLLNQKSEVNNG